MKGEGTTGFGEVCCFQGRVQVEIGHGREEKDESQVGHEQGETHMTGKEEAVHEEEGENRVAIEDQTEESQVFILFGEVFLLVWIMFDFVFLCLIIFFLIFI